MGSSNNYFQLVLEMKNHLDNLNQILKGGESDDVIIDGVVKPSISKDIKQRYGELSAMVSGHIPFKTKALLDGSGQPPSGELAEVWGDPTPEYNGLYGWDVDKWIKSPYSIQAAATQITADMASMAISSERNHNYQYHMPEWRNLTDDAEPGYTFSHDKDGMTISQTRAGRHFLYTTDIVTSGRVSKMTSNCTILTLSGVGGFGLRISDDTTWLYETKGTIVVYKKYGSGSVVKTGLKSLAPGDYFNITLELSDDGQALILFDLNGELHGFYDNGIPQGKIELHQQGACSVKYSAKLEGLSDLVNQEIISNKGFNLSDKSDRNIQALNGLLKGMKRTVPSGLDRVIPYDTEVFKSIKSREFFTNIDLYPPLVPGGRGVVVVYVDPVNGDDGNTGGESDPYKSLKKAASISANNLIIMAKPAIYDNALSFSGANPKANIFQVQPWGQGKIVSSKHYSSLVWTNYAGSTYISTVETVSDVFDSRLKTSEGDYKPLKNVSSISSVQSTPGSYYIEETTIYVRLHDDREPDDEIMVYAAGENLWVSMPNGITYLEDVLCHGGSYPCRGRLVDPATSHTIFAKRCEFSYGRGDGFDINGHFLTVTQECLAAQNMSDGFNYHAIFGSAGPNMVEIDCVGRCNGRNASGTNNGSSMHDPDSVGIRVNGKYYKNEHRNVHDIGGSFAWNIGCESYSSQTQGYSNWCAGLVGEPSQSILWLDTCDSSGSTYDLETASDGSGIIYTFNLVTDGNNKLGTDHREYIAE